MYNKVIDIVNQRKHSFCFSANRFTLSCALAVLTLAVEVSMAAEGQYATGTAFSVSSNGEFLTNAHVVEHASSIVLVYQGKEYPANFLGMDSQNDLAVIKIEHASVPLLFSPISEPTKGEEVYTLGFPNPTVQGFESKYTKGEVSSLSGLQGDKTQMQISVPLQPGNSGGPLINKQGQVVGIISSKLDPLEVLKGQRYLPEAVGYAIKTSLALSLLKSLSVPIVPPEYGATQDVSEVEKSLGLVIVKLKERSREPVLGPNSSARENEAPPAKPAPHWEVYVVQPGDSLVRIASAFEVDWKEILRWNGMTMSDRYRLTVGQRLRIWVSNY